MWFALQIPPDRQILQHMTYYSWYRVGAIRNLLRGQKVPRQGAATYAILCRPPGVAAFAHQTFTIMQINKTTDSALRASYITILSFIPFWAPNMQSEKKTVWRSANVEFKIYSFFIISSSSIFYNFRGYALSITSWITLHTWSWLTPMTGVVWRRNELLRVGSVTVSYTHLTLTTILLV